jgi:hypothetical protein
VPRRLAPHLDEGLGALLRKTSDSKVVVRAETRYLIGQQDATCMQAATVSRPAEGGRGRKKEKDVTLT